MAKKKETKQQETQQPQTDAPRVLSCVMRKQFALEILAGTKKNEFRVANDFWLKRLCVFEDPEHPHDATGFKGHDVIHFYPYNNKWFLDCEINYIEYREVDDDFRKEYPDEADAPEGMPVFVINLGNVLATNLK